MRSARPKLSYTLNLKRYKIYMYHLWLLSFGKYSLALSESYSIYFYDYNILPMYHIYMYHKRYERNGYSPFWYTCDFVKWFILMTIDQLSPYEIVMWIIEWCFHEKFLNSPLWNNSKSTDIYRYVWFYYIKLNLWLKLLRNFSYRSVNLFLFDC